MPRILRNYLIISDYRHFTGVIMDLISTNPRPADTPIARSSAAESSKEPMSGMHWSLLGLLILIEGLLLIPLGRESGLLGTILLSSVTVVEDLADARRGFLNQTLVEVELQQRRRQPTNLAAFLPGWLAFYYCPGYDRRPRPVLTVPDIRSALLINESLLSPTWNAAHGN